jgi:hypothetical protein
MNALPQTSRHLALASALLSVVPGAAHAADPGPRVVVLRTSACRAAYDDAALQHAIDVELAARHVQFQRGVSDDAAPPSGVTLSTECDPAGGVSLRVWSSSPRLVVERSVALKDVPEAARARTLALIITEALGPALANATPDPSEAEQSPDQPLPEATPAPGPLGSRLLTREDPYSPWGDLFISSDPYASQAVRIGAAAQLRVALRDDSVLVAYELGASGPLTDGINWGVEATHAGANTWTRPGEREVSWWNAAFGIDAIWSRRMLLALGPRLSFGRLAITDADLANTERTLVTQLGARARLDLPVGNHGSVQTMLAAEHTLGALALTDYTGFDRSQRGWLISWGLGFAVQP